MLSFNINIPKISIIANLTEDHGIVFNLYVNNEYEGSYHTKTDLEYRISLIANLEINRRVQEVLG